MMAADWSIAGLLIALATGLISFWLGRRLSRRARTRRATETLAAARAAESRQQRRARERRERT